MAIIPFNSITQQTIADGDVLNENISTAVQNDENTLSILNDTEQYYTSTKNTVQTYSANEWDNSKITAFSAISALNTNTICTGASKFKKDCVLSSEYPAIQGAWQFSPQIDYSVDAGYFTNAGSAHMRMSKIAKHNAKFSEDSVILDCYSYKLSGYDIKSSFFAYTYASKTVHPTSDTSTYDTFTNSAIYFQSFDSVVKPVDNSINYTSNSLSYSPNGLSGNSIGYNVIYPTLKITNSAICIKGGAYNVSDKSIVLGKPGDASHSYGNLTCEDNSVSLFINASNSPYISVQTSSMYINRPYVESPSIYVKNKSLVFNGHSLNVDDCCITMNWHYYSSNTTYTCNSAISFYNVCDFTTNAPAAVAQNKSIAIGPTSGTMTPCATASQKMSNEYGENLSLAHLTNFNSYRNIYVKGAVFNGAMPYNNLDNSKNIFLNTLGAINNTSANIVNCSNISNRARKLNNNVFNCVSFSVEDASEFNDNIFNIVSAENPITANSNICVRASLKKYNASNNIISESTVSVYDRYNTVLYKNIIHNSDVTNMSTKTHSATIIVNTKFNNFKYADVSDSLYLNSDVIAGGQNDLLANNMVNVNGTKVNGTLTQPFDSVLLNSRINGSHYNSIYCLHVYDYANDHAAIWWFPSCNTDKMMSTVSLCNKIEDTSRMNSDFRDSRTIYMANFNTTNGALSGRSERIRQSIPHLTRTYNYFMAANGTVCIDEDGFINSIAFDNDSYLHTHNIDDLIDVASVGGGPNTYGSRNPDTFLSARVINDEYIKLTDRRIFTII